MKRVLIANRGEIAIRIARTLRELGIESVAVFSEADTQSPHLLHADLAEPIGGLLASESYLDMSRVLDAAKRVNADAIAPGYGFLSENADFADAVENAGLCFIGPPPSAIRLLGSKTEAREAMRNAGVPLVPGGPASSLTEARATAADCGYPVFIKARAGGGGKGMRLVESEAALEAALKLASSEALRAFGDGTVYLEKALLSPRHVEIQVLGDQRGNVVHLGERDCSIQRRHQKVVEESPSPRLDRSVVEAMGEVAVRGARAVGYFSAGTFEFLVDEHDNFYFLEVNARLQVEHPVTELLFGVDLVEQMVRIARGEALGFAQAELAPRGAALECRVYAEEPGAGFVPSPGLLQAVAWPGGPGVRVDSGVQAGSTVSAHYDPLLAKLSVWAPSRPQAIARALRAIRETRVSFVQTNLAFLAGILSHPEFQAGRHHTQLAEQIVGEALALAAPAKEVLPLLALAAATAASQPEPSAGPKHTGPLGHQLSPWVLGGRRRR